MPMDTVSIGTTTNTVSTDNFHTATNPYQYQLAFGKLRLATCTTI
jgi:hypothetical protein